MNTESVDRRRAESKETMQLAEKLLDEGMGADALRAAFYAGIREADAQAAEEQAERATRTPDPRNEAAKGLADALRREFESQNCTCSLLKYIGEVPPCRTCQLGALLAAWEKLQ